MEKDYSLQQVSPKPADEILGLKFHITGDELIRLTKSRAEYHKNRSVYYSEKAAELLKKKASAILDKIAHEEDEEVPVNYNSQAEADTQRFERKAREHLRRIKYFEFVSSHLKSDAVYVLSDSDLIGLELLD